MTTTTFRAITPTAISRPASNIMSSAHLHPFTNIPAHRLMCRVRPDCHGRGARHPFCCRGACEWLRHSRDFICGHGQGATAPFFHIIIDWIEEESMPSKWPLCELLSINSFTLQNILPVPLIRFVPSIHLQPWTLLMAAQWIELQVHSRLTDWECGFFRAGSSSLGVGSWIISHFRIWRDGATNSWSIAMNRGNESKSLSLC